MERLNKFISDCGVCSRRKADELIAQGKIKVNGEVIDNLGYKIKVGDQVEYNGNILQREEHVYFLLNKPSGYITTLNDEFNRRTVLDLFQPEDLEKRIFPVGRLDYDTNGLLIMTNDGELANSLTHPSKEIEKEYLARVNGVVTRKELIKLKNGVVIEGGYKTRPCQATIIEIDKKNQSTLVKIAIHEGKYHQVKLMFESINHEVKKLTRTRIHTLTTEGLKRGAYRKLKIHEVKQLKNL